MRRLVRLLVLTALAVWAWRVLLRRRGPQERAGVSYADRTSLVLEPGSPGFERLAGFARTALTS
jgi:hypothetical protein